MERIVFNLQLRNKVKRVYEDNKTWLVAPAVLVNVGVLAGSQGPLFYSPKDLSTNVSSWNKIPLVVYHPFDPLTNMPVSAKSKGVVARQGVGEVRNAKFSNNKLKAECWFDEAKTRQVDPRVYDALKRNQKIELSTGLFTHNVHAPGTYNGRHYDYVATNYRPDHLAILPDQEGACSLRDGCGVLVNVSNSNGYLINNVNEWIPFVINESDDDDDLKDCLQECEDEDDEVEKRECCNDCLDTDGRD